MSFNVIIRVAGMFIIPVFIVFIPIYLGQRYGAYRSKKSENLKDAPVGSVVGAAFGLLAFMLAFTFQMAANRYDVRKSLLLDEVTNIRTTYLRSGLVPEPISSNSKKMLVEYVNLRVELPKNPEILSQALSRSQQILDTLWKYSESLAAQDRSSEAYSLYTTSVNDLFDNFNHRVSLTFEYRIPAQVIWILSIIAFFSMLALGYQFGISGKGSFRINLLLAVIFALVMFLILILDHPELGLAKVNQRPMLTLQQQLQSY